MARLLTYAPKDTWIHRLSGVTKMLFFILWSVVGMLTYDTRILVVMLLFSLVVFKVSKTEWKQVGTVFKFILLFLCMNIVIVYLFSPYEGCSIYGTRTELFHIAGRYSMTAEQLFYELNIMLKYFTVVPVVLMFMVTTNPSEFAASLNRLGVSYKVGYSMAIALRYVPDVQADFTLVDGTQTTSYDCLELGSDGEWISKESKDPEIPSSPMMWPWDAEKATFRPDRSKEEWPKDWEAANRLWENRLKYDIVNEILSYSAKKRDAEKTAEKRDGAKPAEKTAEGKGAEAAGGDPAAAETEAEKVAEVVEEEEEAPKTFEEKLAKAEKEVLRRYERLIENYRKADAMEIQEIYLNTLSRLYDPHSSFLSEYYLEEFDISVRNALVGIGALLQDKDGYCTISELMPGGPAEECKQISPGDKILGVGQETGEIVDVIGMKLRNTVRMIRGKSGTKVRLLIEPASNPSARKTITLVRREIKLTTKLAKAEVYTVPVGDKTLPVGVIDLPAFYGEGGFSGESKGFSTTKDEARARGAGAQRRGQDGAPVGRRPEARLGRPPHHNGKPPVGLRHGDCRGRAPKPQARDCRRRQEHTRQGDGSGSAQPRQFRPRTEERGKGHRPKVVRAQRRFHTGQGGSFRHSFALALRLHGNRRAVQRLRNEVGLHRARQNRGGLGVRRARGTGGGAHQKAHRAV